MLSFIYSFSSELLTCYDLATNGAVLQRQMRLGGIKRMYKVGLLVD